MLLNLKDSPMVPFPTLYFHFSYFPLPLTSPCNPFSLPSLLTPPTTVYSVSFPSLSFLGRFTQLLFSFPYSFRSFLSIIISYLLFPFLPFLPIPTYHISSPFLSSILSVPPFLSFPLIWTNSINLFYPFRPLLHSPVTPSG